MAKPIEVAMSGMGLTNDFYPPLHLILHEYLSLAELKYYLEPKCQRILGNVVSKVLIHMNTRESTEGSCKDSRPIVCLKKEVKAK